MIRYPSVANEFDTLAAVCAGRSLARFGDGEFKLCRGQPCVSQRADERLAKRLRGILRESGQCLVGLPRIHSATPKRAFWKQFERMAPMLNERRLYYSSFVTRPDSAPWIDIPAYWSALETLWQNRPVTLVRGSGKSLTAEFLQARGAQVREILAPRRDAWAQYPELLEAIGRPARALLCLGPTATVLAVDLCARGVHAVDCGHVAMFLRKHLAGSPMIVTDADRAQEVM